MSSGLRPLGSAPPSSICRPPSSSLSVGTAGASEQSEFQLWPESEWLRPGSPGGPCGPSRIKAIIMARGPPRRRLNDTSSPSMKSDLQRQMRKWLRLTGFSVFLQIRAAAIMGKMGRSDVVKKPVLPLPCQGYRRPVWTANCGLGDAPAPPFPSPFPPKWEKNVN